MKITPGFTKLCVAVILFFVSSIGVAQVKESVGQVILTEGEDNRIERAPDPINPLDIPIEQGVAETIRIDDTLIAGEDSYLKFSFRDVAAGNVLLDQGRLRLTGNVDDPVCELIDGTAVFRSEGSEDRDFQTGDPVSCKFTTEAAGHTHEGTEFVLTARGHESSVFVMEGVVEVTSSDPEKFPGVQLVHAGEWLRARKGMPIPPPQRWKRSGPGSGSSNCITSNCRLTDEVPIPFPPVVTPQALPPPPFNPPGKP